MSWKGKPTDFTLKVIESTEEKIRKTAADMLQGVILASPVDTGQFRSNHRVSLNAPDTTEEESNGNTSPIGSMDSKVLNKGLNILKSAKIGGLIYIQNNLPYAQRLEHGHSQQGMHIYKLAFIEAVEKNK